MTEQPEIILLNSFCGLQFGSSKDEAVEMFGTPEEIQELTDDILHNNTMVYHYWDKGYSLFFDKNRDQKFSSVEIDNRETLLFDIKLFTLREKELVLLMNENGYALSDTETHEWGEKRVSFDKAGLDCYFENNRMVSVNCGIPDTGNNFYFFPN
jgi:hypothetical protein